MKARRKYQRFIRRLEVEFTAKDQSYRGISSNFSLSGLFVRTNHAFAPGTITDLTIHLSDSIESRIKGIVKVAYKTPGIPLKNGMGIEILENDSHYANFVSSCSFEEEGSLPTEDLAAGTGEPYPEIDPVSLPDFLIIPCPQCTVRNKVKKLMISQGPRCGKCGALLTSGS